MGRATVRADIVSISDRSTIPLAFLPRVPVGVRRIDGGLAVMPPFSVLGRESLCRTERVSVEVRLEPGLQDSMGSRANHDDSLAVQMVELVGRRLVIPQFAGRI
jgi:hypothetical protein